MDSIRSMIPKPQSVEVPPSSGYAHSSSLPFDRCNFDTLVETYRYAKQLVSQSGFQEEIDWQDSLHFCDVDESSFLRESAWVVLSAGMRESIVRRCFPLISSAFFNWSTAALIAENEGRCIGDALSVFKHERKINAIASIATLVNKRGFESVREEIQSTGLPFLATLPYIGPTTCFHLAKNLGLDVVKPDRHLVRIAERAGFESPSELCRMISDAVGDRLGVVDVVIWRFATLKINYLDDFARGYQAGLTE